MKLGPVTKLDKRNTVTPKKYYDGVMSVNCDVIVIFSIDGQFRAIRKPNSVSWSARLAFSLTVTLYLTKTENRTQKSLTQLSYYKDTIFDKIC